MKRPGQWMLLLAAGLMVCLTGCGGGNPPAPAAPATGGAATAAAAGGIAITDAGEQTLVTLAPDGGSVIFRDGAREQTLTAQGSGDTVEYQAADGAVVVVAAATAGGFAVTAGGKTYAVAVSANAVEVSGGASPFIIKTQNANKYLIYSSGSQVGYLKYYPDQLKIKVKNMAEESQFKSNSTKVSALYGMMLMPDIVPAARAAIMAELLRRNR